MTHPMLLHGDYCGSGTVGQANLRVLKDDDDYEVMFWSMFERIRTQLTYDEDDKAWDEIKDDHDGPPKKILIRHAYSTEQMWLLDCEDNEEYIACIETYPVLDECIHSTVEMEWEEEAWEYYIRSDLYSTLDEDLQEALDGWQNDDAKLFDAYRLAMEATNTYPVHEHASTYVDIDRIKDEYNDNVRLLLT